MALSVEEEGRKHDGEDLMMSENNVISDQFQLESRAERGFAFKNTMLR